MNPSLMIDDQGNGSSRDSEFFCQRKLRFSICRSLPNLLYRFAGHFCIPTSLSPLKLFFYRGIQSMLCPCSNPKMRWINASWIITSRAVMADFKIWMNLSIDKFPRKSVRWNESFPIPEFAVTTWFLRSHPDPARFGFKNEGPKSESRRAWVPGWICTVRGFAVEKLSAFGTMNKHSKPFFGCYGGHWFTPLAPTSQRNTR